MDIFTQRRFWIALIPAAVLVGNAFGVPLTEDALTSVTDKVIVGVMGLLSLWSYFQPKRPA
ncbi:MAG TPA: hypothetical protein VJA25_06425 [Dehalococcoidia bacterium]|nr:hypothetical protein [Dehalococcoidia bacterium]